MAREWSWVSWVSLPRRKRYTRESPTWAVNKACSRLRIRARVVPMPFFPSEDWAAL